MRAESKKFKADPSALPEILSWSREKLEENGISNPSKIKLELALEEGIVNILTHGKQKTSAELTIAYRFSAKEYFEWELIDGGEFFDLLLYQVQKQEEVPLEQRKEGGLGIYFIKQMMDVIEYKRKEDKNYLILRKNL